MNLFIAGFMAGIVAAAAIVACCFVFGWATFEHEFPEDKP